MKRKKANTELALLKPSDAGKVASSLVAVARNQVEQINSEIALRQIREIMYHVENLKVQQQKVETELTQYQFILRLVEEGKFYIDMEGHLIINYPDEKEIPKYMRASTYHA